MPAVPSKRQHTWTFLHNGDGPLAAAGSYEIRQRLKKAIPGWPELEATVRESRQVLSVIARTPGAHEWMSAHIGELLSVLASIAQRPVAVDPKTLDVRFRVGGNHLYFVPSLVVEKSRRGVDWSKWQTEKLDEALTAQVAATIESGITTELRRWGVISASFDVRGVVVIDPGRPMPIVRESGPRGMARLGVRFIAPWALEGAMFAGAHTLLGHGIVHRGGQIRKDETSQEQAA